MLGPFRSTAVTCGGYLWKFAPRMSPPQKYRLRSRMDQVDTNVDILYQTVASLNKTAVGEPTGHKKIDRLALGMKREPQMTPRDKYTTFTKHSKDYRKDLHRVPKWTKKSFRANPEYF